MNTIKSRYPDAKIDHAANLKQAIELIGKNSYQAWICDMQFASIAITREMDSDLRYVSGLGFDPRDGQNNGINFLKAVKDKKITPVTPPKKICLHSNAMTEDLSAQGKRWGADMCDTKSTKNLSAFLETLAAIGRGEGRH